MINIIDYRKKASRKIVDLRVGVRFTYDVKTPEAVFIKVFWGTERGFININTGEFYSARAHGVTYTTTPVIEVFDMDIVLKG